jgi:hypothetical protein
MDSFASRVLDSMDIDGFVRILSRFGKIYESGQDHGTLDWINIYSRHGL